MIPFILATHGNSFKNAAKTVSFFYVKVAILDSFVLLRFNDYNSYFHGTIHQRKIFTLTFSRDKEIKIKITNALSLVIFFLEA